MVGRVLKVVEVRQVVRVGTEGGGRGCGRIAHARGAVGIYPYVVGGESGETREGVVGCGSGVGGDGCCRVVGGANLNCVAAAGSGIGPADGKA